MKEVTLNFDGKTCNLEVRGEELNIDLSECLEAINNDELYDYLYSDNTDMFDEINNDSYFGGKTIKSGADLKKSIEEFKVIARKNNDIYICGEYWCDPEHGFSIKFPNGKFVKNHSYDKSTTLGYFSDYIK